MRSFGLLPGLLKPQIPADLSCHEVFAARQAGILAQDLQCRQRQHLSNIRPSPLAKEEGGAKSSRGATWLVQQLPLSCFQVVPGCGLYLAQPSQNCRRHTTKGQWQGRTTSSHCCGSKPEPWLSNSVNCGCRAFRIAKFTKLKAQPLNVSDSVFDRNTRMLVDGSLDCLR